MDKLTQTLFIDGTCTGDVERQVNEELAANKDWEIIDIKYQMLTDPACDHQLYVTALIIYKVVPAHG